MKTLGSVLLVTACFVACTHSFPGMRDDDDSDEKKNLDTVWVLPSATRDRFMRPMGYDLPGVVFDDSEENPTWSWPGLFRTNPFDGFYSGMQAMMKRLREQMADILSRIPEQGVVPWGKIPEGANTTSTTKIINGHVVTINDTTYMGGDDEYGSVIRFRIIDVKPQNDTIPTTESEADAEVTTLPTRTPTTGTATSTAATSSEEATTPSRNVETVEEFDNEIPKNQVDTLTA